MRADSQSYHTAPTGGETKGSTAATSGLFRNSEGQEKEPKKQTKGGIGAQENLLPILMSARGGSTKKTHIQAYGTNEKLGEKNC